MRRNGSSSAAMEIGAFRSNQPLQFEHPMLLDAVPDVGCPQDLSVFQSPFQLGAGRDGITAIRPVITDPLHHILVPEQVLDVRDGRMSTGGWQTHITNPGTARRAIIVGGPISEVIPAQQIEALLEAREFLHRIGYLPE